MAIGEVRVGDIIDLDTSFLYNPSSVRRWTLAKVTAKDDQFITLFRPWMAAGDNGYPNIGVEVFKAYSTSTSQVILIAREP